MCDGQGPSRQELKLGEEMDFRHMGRGMFRARVVADAGELVDLVLVDPEELLGLSPAGCVLKGERFRVRKSCLTVVHGVGERCR